MFGGVDFEIKKFLHYFDPANNNDKIWGYVEVEGKIYNFWGRRPEKDDQKKKLTFKRWADRWAASDVISKASEKIRKGYKVIDAKRDADGQYPGIEKVYPNFVASFKNQLMLARLSGRVKGEEV